MPLIRVEYSNNIPKINFAEFFQKVNVAVAETLNADIEKCKSSARAVEDYFVGTGDAENHFVFIDVMILEGRSMEMQQNCANAILALANEYYGDVIAHEKGQLTMRVHEMDKARYFQ